MKWKKIGQLFDPTKHQLPNNCKQFAQSPQALVFDDFIRIYFTTREVEPSGKYLGHIAFVDFDKELKNILNKYLLISSQKLLILNLMKYLLFVEN